MGDKEGTSSVRFDSAWCSGCAQAGPGLRNGVFCESWKSAKNSSIDGSSLEDVFNSLAHDLRHLAAVLASPGPEGP